MLKEIIYACRKFYWKQKANLQDERIESLQNVQKAFPSLPKDVRTVLFQQTKDESDGTKKQNEREKEK